jgi:uncharacterized integral membrane protein
MSERDIEALRAAFTLLILAGVMGILLMLFIDGVQRSEVRDLQRRVGQLEESGKR